MKAALSSSYFSRRPPGRLIVALVSIITGTVASLAYLNIPAGSRSSPLRGRASQLSGRLIPRQSLMTGESPITDGPIVAEHAEIEFVLDNVGDLPVRVLDIESGCGCVKPVAEPPVVEPRGKTVIVAQAITPVGGRRDVALRVRTDSNVESSVLLTARLIARRKAPFLYDVTGDLSFRGAFIPNMSREISVVTFEPEGSTAEPGPSVDLPFVEIQSAGRFEEDAGGDASPQQGHRILIRTRRYMVRL